ncbi:hypothetical protein KAR91_29595, partial [Candidatus Pacearchaeota archaeon]|nr:hypothetical protein [Candidatus Pacearchaeota archaeon]
PFLHRPTKGDRREYCRGSGLSGATGHHPRGAGDCGHRTGYVSQLLKRAVDLRLRQPEIQD